MRVRSRFVCPHCARETMHEVHYAGEKVHEIRCTRCGRERYAHHHPVQSYFKELRGRVGSKPRRMFREISQHPRSLVGVPVRVLSKPARIAGEFLEVLR